VTVDASLLGTWTPGLGDPSLLGWLTVAAYAATAVLVGRALRSALRAARAGDPRASPQFWGVLLLGTLVLGVNKQLDLQSGLVELGRTLSRDQGWYEHRRAVQAGFVVVGVLACGALCWWLARLARRELRRVLPALVGWSLLCAFVAIRALSFHHLDRLLGWSVGGARLGAVLELSGIAILAVGATHYVRDPRFDAP
jgi:hypothetical protein